MQLVAEREISFSANPWSATAAFTALLTEDGWVEMSHLLHRGWIDVSNMEGRRPQQLYRSVRLFRYFFPVLGTNMPNTFSISAGSHSATSFRGISFQPRLEGPESHRIIVREPYLTCTVTCRKKGAVLFAFLVAFVRRTILKNRFWL